jgi:pseudaminic acid synthase
MNEKEFSEMVKSIRQSEKAIGVIDYNLTDKQNKGKDFSRSLYVVNNIKEGDIFTENNIKSIRPGFGTHPKNLHLFLGKKSNVNLVFGDRLLLNHIKK